MPRTEVLEIQSNHPDGVELSVKAEDLLDSLDQKITEVLKMPCHMNFRFTVIPQTYYDARVAKGNSEIEDAVFGSVSPELIESLFEEMAKKEAWLSGTYEIMGERRRCFFNYMDRFNRYWDHWRFTNDFTSISPKRGALIRFFDRYPRKKEPKWVNNLRWEEANLKNFLENEANPQDIYSEALITPRAGGTTAIVEEVWSVLSDLYEERLLKERKLLEYFVDNELASKQPKALKTLIEDPLIEEVLENSLEWWGAEKLLSMGDDPFILDSGGADYSCTEPEELDEMLEDHFRILVKMQSVKRFPDLGF